MAVDVTVLFGIIGALAAIVTILVVVVNWAVSAGVIKQRLTSIEQKQDIVIGQIQVDVAEVRKTAEKAHSRLDEHITEHLKGVYNHAKQV